MARVTLKSFRSVEGSTRLRQLVRDAYNATRRLHRATGLGAKPGKVLALTERAIGMLRSVRARAVIMGDDAWPVPNEKVHGSEVSD